MSPAIWMLTAVNLICYLDRYIIAAAAPRIQSEFALTNAQTGTFMSMFMIGYILTSPIFGYYGDRKSRPVLMAIGVLLWSLATLWSGLANNFFTLLAARAFVGIGEASFATLSPPFIRDSLKDESTINRVLGFFYISIPVGAALGYIWGGWMADIGHWRWAFYLGALPGFILTYWVWTMPEPQYRVRQTSDVPFLQTLKELLGNRDYRLAVGGYIAQTFALGGFSAWAPKYGEHVLNVSLTESSLKIGASTLASGIIGTLIGAKWGNFFINKSDSPTGPMAARAYCKFCAWTSVFATPLGYWAFRSSHFNEFVVALFLVQTAIFAALAPANTAILQSVPTKIAATAFAVSIFAIHALGDVISPPLAGLLADHMPMPEAMKLLVVAAGVSGVVWFWAGRTPALKPS
jgi:MFS transporter, Spinster family, sphingosine-1-phosphate transporter